MYSLGKPTGKNARGSLCQEEQECMNEVVFSHHGRLANEEKVRSSINRAPSDHIFSVYRLVAT